MDTGTQTQYRYNNTQWGDLLTAYGNRPITRDEIGNPKNDFIWLYTWQHGRQLASMTQLSTSDGWQFTYNADGLRTQRTGSVTDSTTGATTDRTYNYTYLGDQLTHMTVDGHTMYFSYDASGTPLSLTYDGTNYYYVTNLQGDVVAILNSSGAEIVTYAYDAWGNLITADIPEDTLGFYNPLRYRGYVYDTETELYYLQSRYYNPEMGRFVNADAFVGTGQGLLGNNMFAYCGNNPIVRLDLTGTRYCAATSISKEQSYERRYACYWQKQVALEKNKPKPIGRYAKGNVYLVTDPNEILTNFSNDVIVVDNRGPKPEDNVEIRYSFLITNQELQREILTLLYNYEQENPTGWNRTVDSMMIEWDIHNEGAFIGNYVPFCGTLYSRSIHACFDNESERWSKWDHYVDGARKVFG